MLRGKNELGSNLCPISAVYFKKIQKEQGRPPLNDDAWKIGEKLGLDWLDIAFIISAADKCDCVLLKQDASSEILPIRKRLKEIAGVTSKDSEGPFYYVQYR